MRARLENLLEIIVTTLDEPTQAKVLGKLGRECGKKVVKGFERNPEGFWTHIKTQWLDRVEYDKEEGIYESLFNRPVKVKLEESILHGAKRCSFTITLQS